MMVFIYSIKRILRDKGMLLSMIVLPIAFITLTMIISGDGEYIFNIGVADFDGTSFTEDFIKSLESRGTILRIEDEKEIQRKIIDNSLQLGFVIPQGFTRSIMDNESAAEIKVHRINETDVSVPVGLYIENYLGAAKHIAETVNGNEDDFYRGVEYYRNGLNGIEGLSIDNETGDRIITLNGMGFLVMSMLFFSSSAATLILEDKKNKTFYRVLSSPLKLKSYMLQNLLSFLVVTQLQILAIMLLMSQVFKMNMGPSIINLIILLFAFSLVCISFGNALTSLSKDSRQASVLIPLLVMPMVMLGGCFWPRDIMGATLQRVSNFVPTTWILKGIEKVLHGQPITAITTELIILILFSVVFFLLGTWKKSEVTA